MAKNKRDKRRARSQSVEELIAELSDVPESTALFGRVAPDRNFKGRQLVVAAGGVVYSVSREDVLERHTVEDSGDILLIRTGAQVLRTEPVVLGAPSEQWIRAMENLSPPKPPKPRAGDPRRWTEAAQADIGSLVTNTKSIAGAAALYSDSCTGGDDGAYRNNCAHYLSDAFIRAGYSELSPTHDCIEARCETPAKRPIRARDMWCWFKRMAKETRTSLPENQGVWAVFQLKESEYWGGHVVIIDTGTGKYFGTGNYPKWDQYAYKW